MNKIQIIGVGPGAREYLLPIALAGIKRADCLIGAARNLEGFEDLGKETVLMKGNLNGIVSYIKENRAKKKIALLVSGDSGLYSLLGLIGRTFSTDEFDVIPGISALQLAFARIGETWQDARIISLHGRRPGELAKIALGSKKIFLFTDAKLPPNEIAVELLSKGVENRRAVVFERLSYHDEKVTDADLKTVSGMVGFGLCVMIIMER